MESFIDPKCYPIKKPNNIGVANREILDYNWSKGESPQPQKTMIDELQQEIDQVKVKFQEAQNGYAFCCATGDFTELAKHKRNVTKYKKQLSFLLRQRANAWNIYSFI